MTLSDRVLNNVPLASVKGHPTHLTQEKRYPLNIILCLWPTEDFQVQEKRYVMPVSMVNVLKMNDILVIKGLAWCGWRGSKSGTQISD